MVTYVEYQAFSNVSVSSSDFPFVEARAVDILSLLCSSRWDTTSEVCKRAVLYQIEFITLNGGITEWGKGTGTVGSHSWSVGGESESYSYAQASKAESMKVFNGLAISPTAWLLLVDGGYLKTVKGVRVW